MVIASRLVFRVVYCFRALPLSLEANRALGKANGIKGLCFTVFDFFFLSDLFCQPRHLWVIHRGRDSWSVLRCYYTCQRRWIMLMNTDRLYSRFLFVATNENNYCLNEHEYHFLTESFLCLHSLAALCCCCLLEACFWDRSCAQPVPETASHSWYNWDWLVSEKPKIPWVLMQITSPIVLFVRWDVWCT